MGGRLGLRARLLASHLLVVAVGTITLFSAAAIVIPGALEMAMGHAMTGIDATMAPVIRRAFLDAAASALLIAAIAATGAATAMSLVLALRIWSPIARVADEGRRIADGRYAERVPIDSEDEIGELAGSFNRMAEALESTERGRLRLVGDVANELRTPLATVDGYLEGLQDGVVEPSERTWNVMRTETQRLCRLVNDLQELWRAEARQLPMSMTRVEVQPVLSGLASRFSATAVERSVALRVDVGEGVPPVHADPERLVQVLDNLVSNAVRVAPDASRVTISARATTDRVRVAVEDQGPGLTPDQRDRVFERFYRLDTSRSRVLGGSGLGLAISRALVDAMEGRIWAESEGAGRGSTFVIELARA
jgi:histidine kinase